MFGNQGKVPGSAALLRASETGRGPVGRTQSRSTTPDSNHSGDTSDDQGCHDGKLTLYHSLFFKVVFVGERFLPTFGNATNTSQRFVVKSWCFNQWIIVLPVARIIGLISLCGCKDSYSLEHNVDRHVVNE